MKSWKRPTSKQVGEAVALLTKTEHVRYFFEKLQNPKWLKPLREQGLFRRPPKPDEKDGYISFPGWAQSRYLARASEEQPKEALETIRQIARLNIRNARVQMDLVDAALKMPAEYAAQNVPLTVRWVKDGAYLALPDKLGELMARLAREGERDAAFELADVLLEVKRPRGGTREMRGLGIRPDAQPLFHSYEFEEILKNYAPTLVESDGLGALQLLCGKLQKCLLIRIGSRKSDITEDYSHIWRPSIEDHAENHRDIKDTLTNAVRDAAEWILRNDPRKARQVLDIIEGHGFKIFRRIALFLLRRYPAVDPQRLAARLVDKLNFDDPGIRPEYHMLLHEAFPGLSKRKQQNILRWLEEGPDLDDYRRWVSSVRGTPATDEEAENYKQRWQRNRLASISGTLPTRLR